MSVRSRDVNTRCIELSIYSSCLCVNSLNHLVGVWVSDLQRAGNVPGDVDHGDDGFHLLHLVPLEPLQGQLVLISCAIPNKETLSLSISGVNKAIRKNQVG